MKTPALPANETQRLEALARYEILDTPAEQAFDDLTRLASHLLDVPIAVVSLVDEALREGSDFAAMDFSTRDRYRHSIEGLAKG